MWWEDLPIVEEDTATATLITGETVATEEAGTVAVDMEEVPNTITNQRKKTTTTKPMTTEMA
jgi:hypothetical protein